MKLTHTELDKKLKEEHRLDEARWKQRDKDANTILGIGLFISIVVGIVILYVLKTLNL